MGVSGCGKSSVAAELAKASGGLFLDADDFHSPDNRAKMTSGIPLTDEDRWGWIDALNTELKKRTTDTSPIFLACSSLRRVYRKQLAAGIPELCFLYLKGSIELIRSRMESRSDHFMPTSLLDSQFAALEEPTAAEAIIIPIDPPVEEIVAGILRVIRP